MSKFLLTLLLFIIGNVSYSQFLTYSQNGEPVREIKYANYTGSPYIFKEWIPSLVRIGNQYYKNELFNVDLYADKPYFKVNDTVFSFREKINEFSIVRNGDTIDYVRGHLLNGQLPNDFVEVISTKPLIVKQVKVLVSERASYGTATKEYVFSSNNSYYLKDGQSFKKIKLSKDDAASAFQSQWNAIESHAAANKISFKTEEGWRTLGKYYSTLQ